MCYVYATKALEKNSFKVDWSDRFNDLIIECIKLLLRDLDENKARHLSEVQKATMLIRRNRFPEEKYKFLLFFASTLFEDNKAIFSLKYLKEKMKFFFSEICKSENSKTILDEMNKLRLNKPDLALELVHCGIFVSVQNINGIRYFDFPHRRFREVLYSKYNDSPERYVYLLYE